MKNKSDLIVGDSFCVLIGNLLSTIIIYGPLIWFTMVFVKEVFFSA